MPGGDPYKQKTRGEPLDISAYAWNRVLENARRRDIVGASGEVPDVPREFSRIKVRNDSAAAVARFGVLGLSSGTGPLITAAGNLTEFQRQPMLSGKTPAAGDAGLFCVLLEPLPVGAIGWAAVAGVVPVQVTGTATATADVLAGDTTQLAMASAGSAEVLWADAGTGTRWALVRVGAAAGAGGAIEVKDVSGTPDYTGVTVLETDATQGVTLTNPGAGVVKINVAASGGSGDIEWESFRLRRADAWYAGGGMQAKMGGADFSSFSAAWILFMPFVAAVSGFATSTMTKMGAKSGPGSAASIARFGLYKVTVGSSPNIIPDTLVKDFGSVSFPGAASFQSVTPAAAAVLTNNLLYWLAVTGHAGMTLETLTDNVQLFGLAGPMGLAPTYGNAAGNTSCLLFVGSGDYATNGLPATVTGLSTNPGGTVPAIFAQLGT